MRVKELSIKNFRCVKESKMAFDELTVLVGENGTGKSSFLQAIRYFFTPNSSLDIEDFYNRNIPQCKVEIQITFSDLTTDETEAFRKYTRGGTLTVNKIYETPGKGKYYGYTEQIEEFKNILDSDKSKPDMRNDFNALALTEKFAGMERASSYDSMREIMDRWVEAHPDQAQVLPIGTEFYGFAGQYTLDNWTKNVFVPAVKEAEEEIDRGSLKELMDAVVLRKIGENEEVRHFNENFRQQAEEIFTIENFPALQNLSSELSSTLGRFSPGSDIGIKWGDIKAPVLAPPSYTASVGEDGFRGAPAKKGHGLQRALVITLLQHMKATESRAIVETEDQHSREEAAQPRVDMIFTIEEPELYLHPHRARYLSQLFYDLVKERTPSGTNQIIYSTHSPFFVELDRFENIRVIRKIDSGQAEMPRVSKCYRCSHDGVMDVLRKTCDVPKEVPPEQSFLYRCRPVINAIVNEGLFAKAVLVGEGMTEVGIFQKLAEILDKKWDADGIIVVPSSGKNNLDRLVAVFRGFGIPTYFVFDADANESDKSKKARIADKNNKFQKHLGGIQDPKSFPETYANEKFALFHDNIEEEMKRVLGTESFHTIRDEVADKLGILNKEKLKNLLKNVECAARFIELVYQKKLKVPILEQIVEYTTQLSE